MATPRALTCPEIQEPTAAMLSPSEAIGSIPQQGSQHIVTYTVMRSPMVVTCCRLAWQFRRSRRSGTWYARPPVRRQRTPSDERQNPSVKP